MSASKREVSKPLCVALRLSAWCCRLVGRSRAVFRVIKAPDRYSPRTKAGSSWTCNQHRFCCEDKTRKKTTPSSTSNPAFCNLRKIL